MPRGHPDYGNFGYENAFNLDTQDQSFVSEYGIVPITNAGRVYQADFFRNGFDRWVPTFGNGAIAPGLYSKAGRKLFYPYSLRLSPQVNGGEAVISQRVYTNIFSKQGFEYIWIPDANHGNLDLLFTINVAGGKRYDYYYGYDIVEGAWYTGSGGTKAYFLYPDTAGAYQQLQVRCKFVLDVPGILFDKFYIGDATFDLSSIAPTVVNSTFTGLAQVFIYANGESAVLKEDIYIAGFIWTVDEP